MEDIIKIVKYFKNFGLLLKGVSETIQNEAKKQKIWFLSMLLVTLVASLLANILAVKELIEQEKDFLKFVTDLQSKANFFNTFSSFN